MSSFNSRKTLAKFCIFSRKNECIYFKLRFYFRDNLIYSNNKLHFVVVLCGYKCVDHCRKHALPTSSMHWYVAEQCNTFTALMKHQRTHFTVYVLNYVFLWFSLQLSKNHFKHSKTFKYWKYWKIFFNDRYYHHGLLKTTKKSFHCLYLHLSLNIIYKNWG